MEINLDIPEKLTFLLEKKARYKIVYGGRGSGKSWSIATALILLAFQEKHKVLCTRAYQNSILESVHSLLIGAISRLGLQDFFVVTKTGIKTCHRGKPHLESEFIFKGLQNNIDEIKSMEGITICWVEEAHSIQASGWDTLLPTIRFEGSEVWVSFNPRDFEDATYQYFIENPRPDSIVQKVNYNDNPFFERTALVEEMEYCRKMDYEKYKHVWLGEPKSTSESLIFTNWKEERFDEPTIDLMYNKKIYFGADFGWNDPNVAIRCFLVENKLYITHEIYKSNILTDEFAKLLDETIPDIRNFRFSFFGDSSRPDVINDLYKKHGFKNIQSVKKTTKHDDPEDKMKEKSYVLAGIAFLKNFEIIIHPRCVNTISEFRSYKWETDISANGEDLVLTDQVPKGQKDHAIDALRYAVAPLFLKRKTTMADIARSIMAKQ